MGILDYQHTGSQYNMEKIKEKLNSDSKTSIEYRSARTYRYPSRYSSYRTILNKDYGNIHIESMNNTFISSNKSDQYYTVTINTKDRLDIIANMFYNNPIYWWIIAKANNMTDAFNVPVDTVLRIPSLSSVYSSKGVI